MFRAITGAALAGLAAWTFYLWLATPLPPKPITPIVQLTDTVLQPMADTAPPCTDIQSHVDAETFRTAAAASGNIVVFYDSKWSDSNPLQIRYRLEPQPGARYLITTQAVILPRPHSFMEWFALYGSAWGITQQNQTLYISGWGQLGGKGITLPIIQLLVFALGVFIIFRRDRK